MYDRLVNILIYNIIFSSLPIIKREIMNTILSCLDICRDHITQGRSWRDGWGDRLWDGVAVIKCSPGGKKIIFHEMFATVLPTPPKGNLKATALVQLSIYMF